MRKYLSGGELNLARSELEDHCQCRFGRWYDHEGKSRYGDMSELLAIEEVHRHLHEVGVEAVALKEDGKDHTEIVKSLRAIRDELGSRLRSLQPSRVQAEHCAARQARGQSPGRRAHVGAADLHPDRRRCPEHRAGQVGRDPAGLDQTPRGGK
ncbi:CZB domain-containing protein [Acidihalobacter aeolianus]|uniref:CZB domain-containing protein n=1 Tax=Acidihalobacter aeolianus TaxID=2792603 RepID=UPI0009F1E394|nr:CZB domain-containing protein [Acidihalobacter aeolianus]